MSTVRQQVCLPPYWAEKIEEQVESGRFASVSEAIRHAVIEVYGDD